MKKTKILIVLLILGVGGYFAYDKFFKVKDEKVEFITKKAKKGSFSKKVDATGEIFATELVDVGAQVSGQIKKLYVKLGDQVKKGDMIASIDSSTQQNSIDNKEAQLAIYKAQLESAKVALNIAKTQFDRENALFAKNATSKQEFESAKNTFSANSAKIKELEAQIKQTNIELSTAKINLGYTKITAPRDGTVVSVQVEEGQTVNANQTTPTIVNIADLSHVKMKMQIAEGDITKIKVGTPVEYSILSEPTKKFQTTVSSIDPGLTTLSDGSYGSSSSSKSSYSSSSSSSSAVYYYAQSIVDNKEAQLAIYKAQLESAKVALNISKTQFDRENALFAKNATSKQEFESAKNTFSANSAKIKELEAQIKQTNIELSTAKINLGYTKITAPRDGTVVSVQVEEGQTVNANQTTPTIVNIADLSHVKMKMQIAEGDITKIKVGTPVEYSILSEPTKKFQTTVSSIDPGLTTLSDGSYGSSSSSKSSYSSSSSSSSAVYYYAQSIVDNKDGILRIGMTTQNELLIANVKDAIIVPSIGIKKDENGTFVYVLKDGKPVKTAVKTGIKDNLDTQIISGINEGDEIITSQGSSSEIAKMIAKEHKKF